MTALDPLTRPIPFVPAFVPPSDPVSFPDAPPPHAARTTDSAIGPTAATAFPLRRSFNRERSRGRPLDESVRKLVSVIVATIASKESAEIATIPPSGTRSGNTQRCVLPAASVQCSSGDTAAEAVGSTGPSWPKPALGSLNDLRELLLGESGAEPVLLGLW